MVIFHSYVNVYQRVKVFPEIFQHISASLKTYMAYLADLMCERLARHGEQHAYGIYNIPIGYLT